MRANFVFSNLASRRLSLFLLWLVVALSIVACQNTGSSSPESNPTDLNAEVSIPDAWKVPDSAAWAISGKQGRVQVRSTSQGYLFTFTAPSPLQTGAEVWIALWASGIRMGEFKFVQASGTGKLEYGKVAIWDSMTLKLLQGRPDPETRNRDSLLADYAKGLVNGNPSFAGFPGNRPFGIDSAEVVHAALVYAAGTRKSIDTLSKNWLFVLSGLEIRSTVSSLFSSGTLVASDTLSLFPPPPVRLIVPLAVAGSIEAGGDLVDASGRFEWDADLGQITVDAQVTREGRRIETVALTGLSIGSGERFLALTGKARLMAGSAAPVGICSLVVVVRSERGGSARSAAAFEVKAASAPPQAPVIELVSPAEGAVFPFDSASIEVVWKVKSARSPVDTVFVAESLATKTSDSTWKARIPLAATGRSALVAVRARNAQGLWGTGSANFTRGRDQVAPDLVWIASGEDTALESDATFFVARLRATDASGIASVTFDGQAPDSVIEGGVYVKRIALGAPGTSTTVFVAATDSAGNRTEASRKVTRKASNSLEIYGLPDTLRLWEDSVLEQAVEVNCPTGATCVVTAKVSDTLVAQVVLAGSAGSPVLQIVAKPDRNGVEDLEVELSTGTRKASAMARLVVKPVNDAPSLSVKASAMASPLGEVRIANWLVSSSTGPSDESGQKLRYAVVADSAAALLSGAPSIDAGSLVFVPKGISGTVRFAIVAMDDGDSVAPSVNKSAPQTLRVKLDAPPTLRVRDTLVGYEDQRTGLDTVRIDDLENPGELNLEWTVLDSALLPRANLRVKSVPGGYSYDALGAPDSNGLARIVWTLTDPSGNLAKDTTVVSIVPVNHPPVARLTSSWASTQEVQVDQNIAYLPKVFIELNWGDPNQSGKWDIRLANAADAEYFTNPLALEADSTFRIKPSGKAGEIVILLILKDDGGTDHGGVDTASYPLRLRFTNTVSDLQGNLYSYRKMPDGRWWMEKNLRTRPTTKSVDTCGGTYESGLISCDKYGALYTWVEAMKLPDSCYTGDCSSLRADPTTKDICPERWHVASRSEWATLFRATAKRSDDSTLELRSKDPGWANNATYPVWTYPGENLYLDFIHPTAEASIPCKGCYGVNYWMPESDMPGYAMQLVITDGLSDYAVDPARLGSVRCIRN